jgi:hypothetical protein
MFEEDKEEWHMLFDYYKKRFDEAVGVMCGALDTEDFEIDLFAGETSGKIYGMRLYQVMELEEGAAKEEEEDDEGEKEVGEEGGEEYEDEDDEEESDVMVYDLVVTPKAKIQGKVAAEATVDLTEEETEGKPEEVRKLNIKIYTEDGDVNAYVTGAVGTFEGKPASHLVFIEPPELK